MTLDISSWKRVHSDAKNPFWWGVVGLILIESTVVATFLASFFYLWLVSLGKVDATWQLPSNAALPLLYPNINLVLLLVCAASMYFGGVVMEEGRGKVFALWSIVCCLAGTAILILRWLYLSELSFDHTESAFSSFLWTLMGFHIFHVLSGVLGTALIGWLAYQGYYTRERFLGVKLDTIYWYYIVIAWLPMYVSIFWAPRLIGQ